MRPKRSLRVQNQRTSISLEAEFWAAFKSLAERRGLSINALATEIDGRKTGNLSSACRIEVLKDLESTVARLSDLTDYPPTTRQE